MQMQRENILPTDIYFKLCVLAYFYFRKLITSSMDCVLTALSSLEKKNSNVTHRINKYFFEFLNSLAIFLLHFLQ